MRRKLWQICGHVEAVRKNILFRVDGGGGVDDIGLEYYSRNLKGVFVGYLLG